jgi:hypothetical protein
MPQVTSPISADPSVWAEPSEIEYLTEGVLPPFANPLCLAKSIDLLTKACEERGISTGALWPVCVTSSDAIVIPLIERYGPGYFENLPREEDLRACGWQFLGFDVVDLRGLISGLKGCGYLEPSWTQLRNYFGGELNEVGLFKDQMTAFEFAQARGAQISQHAPFIAMGIFKNTPL